MPSSDYFSVDYGAARATFLSASQRAAARLSSYPLPGHAGPSGERLAIDVAALGPSRPEAMLLLISGTHGAEGLAGSGCQVGFLVDELHGALPKGCGALLIHGLNPHGFAWGRRGNEDNIDLNRNGCDFSLPLPDNPAYSSLHNALVPKAFDGPERQRADAQLARFIQENGVPAYQAILQRGQYSHPDGLFYGGTQTSWSLRTLGQILADHLVPATDRLAVIDLHTGLGPWGYGELICSGASAAGLERARRWYGPEVTDPSRGPSQSAAVTGALSQLFQRLVPDLTLTYLALEFGTLPIEAVLAALRADAWLHAVPDRDTPHRNAIRQQLREAFLVDSPAWKAAVYGRTADVVLRACRALGSSPDQLP